MANRHKAQRASGGRVFYAGGNSNVAKEAFERKHGGKVVGKMEGMAPKHRMDRRARGGKVGSDKHPFAAQSAKAPFSSAKKD